MSAAPGSFRDPQGQVIELGGRIYRALQAPLAPFPDTWSEGGPLADLVSEGKVWPGAPLERVAAPATLLEAAPAAAGFLEHPRLDPITFPYEWPFTLLKRAALLHLEVHREVLRRGLTLSDGFAFNVQFVGSRPVFIDALAFVPYVEGQPWAGYTQFCESFLNPLLLASRGNSAWLDMYRGRLRGISTRETARELGWLGAMRAGAFMHVILNSLADSPRGGGETRRQPNFSKAGMDLLLASLEKTIRKLEFPGAGKAGWQSYEGCNSYSDAQRAAKHAAVKDFIGRLRPKLVLDIGCNTGEYSQAALEAGAASVVGLERDEPSVNRAVARADALDKPFLPLQVDVQNPSPAQGWALAERRALPERVRADAMLSLAVLHHVVLGEGVPLDLAVPGLVALAPRGIIEFVPLHDPMSQRIAGPAERLRHPYDLETFRAVLSRVARIQQEVPLSENGRVLVEYGS